MHSSNPHTKPSATPASGSRLGVRGAVPAKQNSPSSQADAVDSQSLLDGRSRIAIRHRDETYWLHETRQGKLLLTK